MVLTHQIESIVMLTSLIENKKVKCYEYYPNMAEVITFRDIKVICVNEQDHTTFVKSIIAIEKVWLIRY